MNLFELQKIFFNKLSEPFTGETLFDHMIDIVFFIKDSQGRYIVVNQSLVERCGFRNKEEVIGKKAEEVYRKPFGLEYSKQDEELIRGGKSIINNLEIQISAKMDLCWGITTKVPLYGKDGLTVGLAGISRNIKPYNKKSDDYSCIAKSVEYIKANFHKPLKVDALAKMTGLTTYQYDKRMQKIFSMTIGQFIQKTRIEAAMWRLSKTNEQIVNIALDCGYTDQSAFSRQFNKTTGLSPIKYRQLFVRR